MGKRAFSLVEPSPAKNLLPVFERLEREGWDVRVYGHGRGAEVLRWEGRDAPTLGRSRRGEGWRGYLGFAVDLARVAARMARDRPSVVLSSGNTGDARKSLLAAAALRVRSVHVEMDVYNPVEAVRFASRVLVPFSREFARRLRRRVRVEPEVIPGPPLAQYLAERHLRGRVPGPVPRECEGRVLVCLGGDVTTRGARRLLERLSEHEPLVVPFRVDAPSWCDRVEGFVDLPGAMMVADVVVFSGGFGVTIEACVVGRRAVKVWERHPRHLSHWIARESGVPVLSLEEAVEVDPVSVAERPEGGWLVRGGEEAVDRILAEVER